MRRSFGFLLAAMLTLAPCIARAQPRLPAPPDLRTNFLLRFFAEVSDGRTSFTASGSDVLGASPLRTGALFVNAEPALRSIARFDGGVDAESLVRIESLRKAMPSYERHSSRPQSDVMERVASALPLTSAYATAPPTLFASAGSNKFSFTNGPSSAVPQFVTQSTLNDTDTLGSQLDQSLRVPLTLRLGNVHVLAGFNAGQASLPSTGLANTLPVFVPAYVGVNRSDLGANFAVPLTSRLLFGVGYNTEHLVTGYGVPTDVDGLDGRNDTYSGNLTFLFPRLSSAVSFSAQQYRYQDNLVPAEFTQLRENVDLTVKF